MGLSRALAISGYIPAFSKGAKIYGANIQSGVVTSAHIADGTIFGADVGAGAITSAKLGAAAVVAAAIGAGAVTSAKIGAVAVVAANIGAAAVTSAKLGTGAVTNAKMKAAFLSGTISGLLSGVIAVAHGLAVKPKSVVVSTLAAHADVVAGRYVFPSAASASTSANIYLKSSKSGNVKYTAYVQI